MTEYGLPIVGVPCCVEAQEEGGAFHKVGEKYLMAVARASHCMPLMIPALGDWYDPHELAAKLDGLMLTGSPSHHDPVRDATTLPLIGAALETGLPLFAICRGHQELNVALGGTLHQNVQELAGKQDHRSDKTRPHDERYLERHSVTLTPGGVLQTLSGGETSATVNSLHEQAIDRVADRLEIEAVSDDGVVEAVSVKGAESFALSVQWHPEHPLALEWPLSRAMFAAFGEACSQRRASRGGTVRRGGRGRNHAA
jgi:putative glutamine amidotransferase